LFKGSSFFAKRNGDAVVSVRLEVIAIIGVAKDGEATLGAPGKTTKRYADYRSGRLDREAAEHCAESRRRTGRSNLDRVVGNLWGDSAACKYQGTGRVVMLPCDSHFGLVWCGWRRCVPQVAIAIPWASTGAQAEPDGIAFIRADLTHFRRAGVRIVVMLAEV
jgi:hypothetical protein